MDLVLHATTLATMSLYHMVVAVQESQILASTTCLMINNALT